MPAKEGYLLRATVVIDSNYVIKFRVIDGTVVKDGRNWKARIKVFNFDPRGGFKHLEFDGLSALTATSEKQLKQLMLVWVKQLIADSYHCEVSEIKLTEIDWGVRSEE